MIGPVSNETCDLITFMIKRGQSGGEAQGKINLHYLHPPDSLTTCLPLATGETVLLLILTFPLRVL